MDEIRDKIKSLEQKQNHTHSNAKKIILKNEQSPGDIVMLTAAVRDLHLSHPGKFITDVRTLFPDIWLHNPYITSLNEEDDDVDVIDMQYPIIHNSNDGAYHFIHGFSMFLEDQLGIRIKVHKFQGDIYLSDEEKSWVSMVEEHYTHEDTPFWLICTGGKTDYTAKWWIAEYAQEVVDHFVGKIQFVQFGAEGEGHYHQRLHNVIDLIGKTDIRMFMRLMYHADGVVCPVTMAMHLAAAIPTKPGKPKNRACVVTAGGREPSNFTFYTNHQYLHTNGALKCCDNGGCWKSRTDRLGDGDHKDNELCVDTVQFNGRKVQRCMYECVKPIDVIRAIEKHYDGGALNFGIST
ncbi:MAG: ADP-heptose--LPS heptosyltransferase [Candidatus Lokiarchaeota archaeon]|nr:ADP-heptose--LPS heptosyltransferase [Candidatus Lokiarchaeota archaeon]